MRQTVQQRVMRRGTPAEQTAQTDVLPTRDPLREIRWLIWAYFWLLIFEGSLRKWGIPSLANPLLIIRDPVLLAIYWLAYSRRVFPANTLTVAIGVLGALSFVASFFGSYGDIRVAAFGFRCNFLHLPLIYVIGRVFTFEHVRKAGAFILALAVPMTALMVLQFQSPGDAWINRGAGEDAWMIVSIHGRIRPSGTFSFVSGVIFYFSLVTAFFIYGVVQKRAYPFWLTWPAGLALPVALAVSGSRSTVGSAAIIVAAFVVALLCRPSLVLKATKLIVLVFLAASVVGGMAIFREGVEIFTERVEHAALVEGGAAGFARRVADQFIYPFSYMWKVPIFGYGLGSGTNVGAKLLTGEAEFLFAEQEWDRIIQESGAFLGLLFILLRIAIAANIGGSALRAARAGHFAPMLLFGACALPIVNGQLGQTTTLGFACFIGGLAVAALRVPQLATESQPRKRILPAKVRAYWEAIEARKAAARRRPRPAQVPLQP